MPQPKQKQQLRIIGGQWRGRKLAIADVPGLRPTGDRIRETLFNWLMADIADSVCLDLFAGSGALGLECLSRGAQAVTLVEQHPVAAKQLQHHMQTLQAEQATIIQQDALSWLQQRPQQRFDIVFIDPPFAAKLWDKVFEQLTANHYLKTGALIYVESPKHEPLNWPQHWQLLKEKTAGDVSYRLLQNHSNY